VRNVFSVTANMLGYALLTGAAIWAIVQFTP
jgi:hypothetical protein